MEWWSIGVMDFYIVRVVSSQTNTLLLPAREISWLLRASLRWEHV
jgi:hypothetical protein